jgi:fucose 4-O-acetylase-like acetyltransferase
MAKLTMLFGVVLILLGAWGFIATGDQHPTALIPTYFGLALAWCGYLAMREGGRQRMLWMHVAVTAGLLGFLGAGSRAVVETVKAHGAPFSHEQTVAVTDQAAMAAICGIFVGLCVRSFIAARKARGAEA